MVDVKISRINTNPYKSSPKLDRFFTMVEGAHGKWYSHIPEDDFKKLLEIYEQTPHEGLKLDPVRFVFDIDHRIYAEWCMSPGEGGLDWNLHRDYQGEGYKSFIDAETFFASQRAFKKDLVITHDAIRTKVLESVVKKAVELFTAWNGLTYPPDTFNSDSSGKSIPPQDRRNLRDNLESYIGF